jgi:hypothetical protein
MVSCFIILLLIPGPRLGTTGLDVIPPLFYLLLLFFGWVGNGSAIRAAVLHTEKS